MESMIFFKSFSKTSWETGSLLATALRSSRETMSKDPKLKSVGCLLNSGVYINSFKRCTALACVFFCGVGACGPSPNHGSGANTCRATQTAQTAVSIHQFEIQCVPLYAPRCTESLLMLSRAAALCKTCVSDPVAENLEESQNPLMSALLFMMFLAVSSA